MGNEKKIVYLGGFELPDRNAAAQRVMSNAQLLKEMGFEVLFIGTSRDYINAPKLVQGFSSRPVPYPVSLRQWIHHIFCFVNIYEVLSYNPQYVILYNFPSIASLRIVNICHKRGIKVMHDITEWEANYRWSPSDIMRRIDINLRMHYCMKKMDGVIAISRYLFNQYKDVVNTILVPPTVDLSNNKWCRSRTLTATYPITLVYAGSPGGGVKDKLDYIVDVVKRNRNLRLVVVGLNEKEYLESFKKPREEFENIVFRGHLSHIEAVRAVCDADFQMLIRSRNRKNDAGFPTKLAESMACCTPVIATVFSNITDYVKEGKTALFVNDNHTLSEVLEKVAKMSQEEIVSMKRHCLDLRDFDYRHYKKEFEIIFQ